MFWKSYQLLQGLEDAFIFFPLFLSVFLHFFFMFIFCLAQSDKLEFSLSNLFFPGSLEQSLSVTANEPKTYVRTSTLVRGLTAMPLQMNDTQSICLVSSVVTIAEMLNK